MLRYILLAASLATCYKTNPDRESFKAFITNTPAVPTTTTSKITSFLTRAFVGVPEHVYQDYVFFSIVTLKDNSATFLGVLGQWFVVSGGGAGSGALPDINMELEDLAEVDRAKARQAAMKKDYATAGNAYRSAALRLQQGSSDLNQVQAARNFEDALQSAAKIFAANPRQGTRAGQLYEDLGKLYAFGAQRNPEKAIEAYETAARYYEANDDFRYPAQKAAAAALLAEMGRYEPAIAHIESIAPICASDEIRSFKLKDYLYLEALCIIGLDDWVRLGRAVRAWEGRYEGDKWTKTRECRFIKGLIDAKNLNDPKLYRDACEEYDQFTRLQDWQITLLLKGKQALEREDLK
ncbi:soluble NSF attachment protein [Jimgerdemannia flammicorona]|uniref:Soluble NSF attachment protein n=1 Tax=Jimgerdemannia flammicorona TaxID=994334 RepID=A0A433Q9C5_9FUNG|nr:soluble NSF attachment protein [Jimgerdemannia flammicorona]